MPDLEDDGFSEEAFKGFGEDAAPVTPPATPPTPPAEPPVTPPATPPAPQQPKEGEDDADKNKLGDKPESAAKPDDQKPTPPDGDKPTGEEEKPGEGKPAEPATPPAPEEPPKPLTKDDVQEVVTSLLTNERTSGKELETTAKEVLDAYYPDGLSNVLVDERSGKELRTPADVVEVSGGQMTTEEAAQWLMNEQYKLDNQVAKIKNDAKEIAETTVNFKRDSMTVLQKYEPLFKWQPTLQKKAFDLMMKQVKVDKDRGVILSAPDVLDLYDTYLEPYQQAYEFANKSSATNPTPPPVDEKPKPGAEDRMDEHGDGGQTPPDDPNDFAQQVSKELAKGA